jgi:hypothetical protein
VAELKKSEPDPAEIDTTRTQNASSILLRSRDDKSFKARARNKLDTPASATNFFSSLRFPQFFKEFQAPLRRLFDGFYYVSRW